MKKNLYRSAFIFLALTFGIIGLRAEDLPVPSTPSDWVNDYAKVFDADEIGRLSQKLNKFQYNTSTQIFIVTINENNGYEASMLAPMIAEQWQVGQKGKDNGLLLLMDMKEKDVFIATGYGLEEFIPDAIAKRIVENEILPAFREGNFYQGIDAGTDVMISLLAGEFTADEYRQQSSSSSAGSAIGGIIFMIFIFSMLLGSRRRSYGTGRGSSLPFWLAMGMMSGSRSSGSFGGFSSGSGGFGGFSGGGGGSFGGGGAGGSW